jgi:hypothetical protein
MPSALNRCSRRRTVSGWQPSRSAIAGTRIPSHIIDPEVVRHLVQKKRADAP